MKKRSDQQDKHGNDNRSENEEDHKADDEGSHEGVGGVALGG